MMTGKSFLIYKIYKNQVALVFVTREKGQYTYLAG